MGSMAEERPAATVYDPNELYPPAPFTIFAHAVEMAVMIDATIREFTLLYPIQTQMAPIYTSGS